MKSFDDFFTDLTSDQRHYELCQMHYRDETIKAAAWKIYALLLADETLQLRPMSQNRQHLFNLLGKNPPDKKKVDWTAKALEKMETEKKEEWKPVSWEERAKRLEQIQEIIKGSKTINAVPRVGYKQSVEEGGWIPKKEAPYPATSRTEFYLKQRHFEYIRRNYEPRTAMPLPGWISEQEFNEAYDEAYLKSKRKKFIKTNPGASEEEIQAYIDKFKTL